MWEKFFTDFSFMENPELSDLRQMAKKDEIPNRYGIRCITRKSSPGVPSLPSITMKLRLTWKLYFKRFSSTTNPENG